MDALKQIVVGIDFSEASRTALAQAMRLAEKFGAGIRCVHVVEKSMLEQVAASMNNPPSDIETRVSAHARYGVERMVAEIAHRDEKAVKDVQIDVIVGAASHTLAKIAGEAGGGDGTLLVMGTTGQDHPGAGVGTTAGRCVRHGAMDTLLVRRDQAGAFKKIVVCIDFSDTSTRALHLAARLAKQDGAALQALHVFSPPPPAYPPADMIGMWPIPAPDYTELTNRLREDATIALNDLLAKEDAGVSAEPVIVEDFSYGRGIREYAQRAGADLVVIGTQGKTNLRYMLLGSTAEKVLKEAHCSVLAVKPRAEPAETGA